MSEKNTGAAPAAPRRKRRRGGRGCLFSLMYIAFVLGASMILASVAILASNEVFAFVKPDRTAVVEITAGASAKEIAAALKEAGVIEYPALFELYAKLSKAEEKYKSGKYELNAKLDYSAISRVLRRTSNFKETVRITIPEGMNLKQIITLLVDNEVASREDLLEAVKNADYDYSYIKVLDKTESRLEGFLFPDTYEFYVNDVAKNVFAKMIKNFDTKLTEELRTQAKDNNISIRDAVIIASLVEREAKLDDERAVISSVIHNRLGNTKNFPYLQIDATVQYLTGREPTADDLKIDNPYNTYLYKGLPPGPIASPGIASIKAAINPDSTKYYYYVAKSDGSHIFSKTLEEHNKAIAAARES